MGRLLNLGLGTPSVPTALGAEGTIDIPNLRLYELICPLDKASAGDLRASHLYGEALEAMHQQDYLAALGQLKEVVQHASTGPARSLHAWAGANMAE